MQNTTTVVFFTYSKGIGTTYHLVNQAISLNQVNKNILFIHGENEQEPGLNDKLISSVKNTISEKNLSFFLKNHSSDSFIFHCQGFQQINILKNINCNNKKIIITMHSYRNASVISKIFPFIYTLLYKKYVNKWIFTSNHSLRFYKKWCFFSIPTTKIPLGIEAFNSEKSSIVLDKFINKKHYYNENTVYLVYLAQFHKNKRHALLINKLTPYLEKNNARLILFGDGPELNNIIKLTENKNIRHKIIFPGRISRHTIHTHLNNASVSMIPSRSETFGHNFLEPIAAKIPVLASPTGVAEEVVIDYKNGFLIDFEEESSSGIEKKINLLLKINSNEILLENRYKWENIASAINRLYIDLSI